MRRSGSESRARGASAGAFALLTVLAGMAVGCGGAQSPRLADVDGELAHVETDHEKSDDRWGLKLDEREAHKSDDALIATPPPAKRATASSALARPVVRLDDGTATSEGEAAPEGAEDDASRPLLKLGPRGQIEQTDPDEGAPKPVGKKGKLSAPDTQAASDYEQAQKLVGAKKWQAALDALAGFLLRYPDHPYAANAFYWRGECYFAMGDYGSAVAQFEGLLSRFPSSAKVPDTLLKLGLSERKLGSTAKAKTAFDRLRRDYPLSEAAKKIPPEDAP